MKQCSWEQSMANTFVTVPDGYGLPEPIQYYGEKSKFGTLEIWQNELLWEFISPLILIYLQSTSKLLPSLYWKSIEIYVLIQTLEHNVIILTFIPCKHPHFCLPLASMEKTQVLLQYSRYIINR